jgi:MFS family permease
VGIYTSFILIPEFVATPARVGYGFGASISQAGLFMLPMTVATVICSSLTGRVERRYGSKPPMIAGVVLSAVAYLLFAFLHEQRWEIYLAGIILGAGTGFAFAAIINLIIANVARTQTGVATGMNTVMRTAGGAFGGSLVASILGANLRADGHPTEHGFTLAFLACGVALIVGTVVALLTPEHRRIAAAGVGDTGELSAAGSHPQPARSG